MKIASVMAMTCVGASVMALHHSPRKELHSRIIVNPTPPSAGLWAAPASQHLSWTSESECWLDGARQSAEYCLQSVERALEEQRRSVDVAGNPLRALKE